MTSYPPVSGWLLVMPSEWRCSEEASCGGVGGVVKEGEKMRE